jgi:hypothetical protein
MYLHKTVKLALVWESTIYLQSEMIEKCPCASVHQEEGRLRASESRESDSADRPSDRNAHEKSKLIKIDGISDRFPFNSFLRWRRHGHNSFF